MRLPVNRSAIMAFPNAIGIPQARLCLERYTDPDGPTAAWLACNPSVAGPVLDDPTTGRVVGHSARYGHLRSLIGNVWPYISPYPADLWEARRDGRLTRAMMNANQDALAMIGGQATLHVAAFGAVPGRKHPKAVAAALDTFTLSGAFPLYCLGTTDDNQPLHPLARGKYAARNDAELREWKL